MKKVVKPETPAAVEVAKPKVAPKKVALPSPELGKALKAVAALPTSRAQRRTAKPATPAVAPAPEKKYVPVKKTATASLAGTLASISQARHILHNSRSFGEAMDTLGRLEAQAREQLSAAINEELKKGRVKSEGHSIGTESKPDGVHIVLTKQ